MVQVKFSGELKSKGHPSTKWKFPKWLFRLFVWETGTPVTFSQKFEEGDIEADINTKYVNVHISENDRAVFFSVDVLGLLVQSFDFEKDGFNIVERIKVSAAGQQLSGLFEVTWE